MLSILVVGGYDDTDPNVDDVRAFCRELGKQVIDQGHCLIGACQTSFDKEVAEAAFTRVNQIDAQNCEKRDRKGRHRVAVRCPRCAHDLLGSHRHARPSGEAPGKDRADRQDAGPPITREKFSGLPGRAPGP
jgi:hypothetical protein